LKARGKFTEIPKPKIAWSPKEHYLDHKHNIRDHFEFHEHIGDPTTSRTRKAVHLSQKVTRAVKIVPKEEFEVFGERRDLL